MLDVSGARPGPRERHLRRRMHNPLFPAARREVSAAEWDAARRADAEQLQDFMARFQAMVQEAAALRANEESEVVLALKARLDQAYAEACALGGDLEAVKDGLRRLIAAIMGAVRRGAAGDARALAELDDEELAREQQVRLLEHPLVADLLLAASPIPADELAPSLLSASAEALDAALWLFDAEPLAELCAQARAVLAHVPEPPAEAQARLAQLQQAVPVN
ncbi:MAG: hypothetical protein AB7U81_01115 [Thiohalomonadaceae bacterium]